MLAVHEYPAALTLRNDSLVATVPPEHRSVVAERITAGLYVVSATLEEPQPKLGVRPGRDAQSSLRTFDRARYYFSADEPLDHQDILSLGRTFIGLQRQPLPRLLMPNAIVLGLARALTSIIDGSGALPDDMWHVL